MVVVVLVVLVVAVVRPQHRSQTVFGSRQTRVVFCSCRGTARRVGGGGEANLYLTLFRVHYIRKEGTANGKLVLS